MLHTEYRFGSDLNSTIIFNLEKSFSFFYRNYLKSITHQPFYSHNAKRSKLYLTDFPANIVPFILE